MAPKQSAPKSPRLLPRSATNETQSLFQIAVKCNDVKIVEFLLKHQSEAIDMNATNKQGFRAIHLCVINGMKSMLSLLIFAGAEIDAVDSKGWSALHICAARNDHDFCEYLLRKGSTSLIYTNNNELPIDLTKDRVIVVLLADSLTKEGHAVLARYYYSKITHVHHHGIQGHSNIYSSILSNKDRDSPCSCASDDANKSKRSSVILPTNTLFLNYIHNNEYELLDALLRRYTVSILNKLDRKGLSSMHWLAINGFHESIKVLAKNGADVNIVDPNGWTPLHAAVVKNQKECSRELLKHNADPNALTNHGETVFDFVTDDEILNILKCCK